MASSSQRLFAMAAMLAVAVFFGLLSLVALGGFNPYDDASEQWHFVAACALGFWAAVAALLGLAARSRGFTFSGVVVQAGVVVWILLTGPLDGGWRGALVGVLLVDCLAISAILVRANADDIAK
jgi:hypothetical protein